MPWPNVATQFKSGQHWCKEAQSKGGSSLSPRKSISATWRNMRERGVTYKEVEEWYKEIEDSSYSLLTLKETLKQLKSMSEQNPDIVPLYLSHKEKIHQLAHGDKLKTENVHHVLDWTQMIKNAEIRSRNIDKRDV